ncbi:hypothetical protein M595_6079, partial [Lyngbya aestuarii BL J]
YALAMGRLLKLPSSKSEVNIQTGNRPDFPVILPSSTFMYIAHRLLVKHPS